MNSKNAYLFFFIAALTTFSGCSGEEKRNIPDVSDISADISIRRFERDLFQMDTTQADTAFAKLMAQYPEFGPLFFGELLGAFDERLAPNGPGEYAAGFVQHPPLQHLYDTTQIVYNDMQPFEESFEQAFRYYQYYFPTAPLPTVTTFLSEFSIAAFIYGENDLAVSLDFFLGNEFPYRQYGPDNPSFSQYLTRTYTPEHLVSKTLQTLVNDHAGMPSQNRLIDYMVNNGKKLYLLDLLMPYTPDSIKLEITEAQVEWLESNEREMWAFFLKEDLIYSADWSKIRKYVEYSPNSPGMPPEAPGRTANWIGWQIIKSYFRENPSSTIDDMLRIEDAQELLDRARYKPGRG
jgi:hypothetical protein